MPGRQRTSRQPPIVVVGAGLAGLAAALPEERVQFERHGYFVADLVDHRPGKPVFNRAVTLRDSWSKPTQG